MSLKLNQLLILDKSTPSSDGLKNCLLDSYLCRNNRFYKNIRRATKKIGYQFTSTDYCQYSVMPLVALDQILIKRKIPYFETTKVLARIEKKSPGILTGSEMRRFIERKNVVFHESCHALAHEWLPSVNVLQKDFDISMQRAQCFRYLIAEAFAVSCEFYLWVEIKSKFDQEAAKFNLYSDIQAQNIRDLQWMIQKMGDFKTFYFRACPHLIG